jgi:hypothetical protein
MAPKYPEYCKGRSLAKAVRAAENGSSGPIWSYNSVRAVTKRGASFAINIA